MKLSVIIPCYNGARTIVETVNCFYKQLAGLFDYEILVINDGSVDNSAEVIRDNFSERQRVYLLEKENEGVSVARNFGLSKATGDYVWFFDADDLLFDNTIPVLIEILKTYNPDVLKFNSVTVDGHVRGSIDHYDNSTSWKILYDGLYSRYLESTVINTLVWSLILKRSLLCDDTVRFNPSISFMEDAAWNISLAIRYPESHYVVTDLHVVKYMVSSNSAMNTTDVRRNRIYLDSILNYGQWLGITRAKSPDYLIHSLDAIAEGVTNKLITRFLSCRMTSAENNRYIEEIRKWINSNGGGKFVRVFNFVSSHSLLCYLSQLLYRNVFLRMIKPHIRRN